MKKVDLVALTGLVALLSAPALARDVAAPVTARPVMSGPERIKSEPTAPNKGEIVRKIHARAKAAVANGADPAAVRQAVQSYKQKLRRRAAAAN
jgi:hypothetical protein